VVQRRHSGVGYVITDPQSVALDRLLSNARICADQAAEPAADEDEEHIRDCQKQLDKTTLLFCISLLDHRLRGNIYDSLVVGFFAILGINAKDNRFFEAVRYTNYLSAFIKMAQMLVVQRAVMAADYGEVEYPADLLEVIRDRFMIYGSNSPMNWALKLRAYGKKVRDSTTSLGFIIWSEDGSTLSYKDTKLTMSSLGDFVRKQVELAQAELEDLLLIHPDEDRADVLPSLVLRDLKDDPSISRRDWSFLDHPQNQMLQGKDRWLLNRVLDHNWLHEEFFLAQHPGKWRKSAVAQYFHRVDNFLERLLLLFHITSGQPARGTELLSLRVANNLHGIRRNIFIEDGLVSFVTFYHKGYSISGSTKIIHRYLPQEPSELLVYFLWLVRPFCNQLRLLAFDTSAPLSSFLWSKKDKEDDNWESTRLSAILAREFRTHLSTVMNITIWRHTAIAVSRQHLRHGQFKRDYDVVETYSDNQTAHTSLMAGNVYARLLGEAPGHVASARRQYRIVSREWHSFLGFNAYLSRRRSPLQDCSTQLQNLLPSSTTERGRKRLFVEEDQEGGNPAIYLESQACNEIEIRKKVRDDLVRQNRLRLHKAKRRRRL
jgi:hypothetical protein